MLNLFGFLNKQIKRPTDTEKNWISRSTQGKPWVLFSAIFQNCSISPTKWESFYYEKAVSRSLDGPEVWCFIESILDQFPRTMKAADRVKPDMPPFRRSFTFKTGNSRAGPKNRSGPWERIPPWNTLAAIRTVSWCSSASGMWIQGKNEL